MLLNCLLSALEANDDCFRRIKNIVSVEALKVNLIWVYRDFIEDEKGDFCEELLELQHYDLNELIDPKIKVKTLILEIAFALYPLIKQYEADEE